MTLRRKEFTVTEQAEINAFLDEMTFGYLATVGEDGWPHIKALNFVHHEDAVYIHGSRLGEKISDFKRDNRVTFAVAREFSLIPSYFSDEKLACPATTFFKSVSIRGTTSFVEDLDEKARAFTLFMQKLQPEGGYDPIDPSDKEYRKNLNGVSLIKISIEDLTAKFKFGQNLTENSKEDLINRLEERGTELDQETVEMMKKFCPHHAKQSSSGN
ncbi:MAG TPA: pyridoxamine 5'-phosphate oxidase family protein [Bacilli bacterium]|nr:pyridoxamine 5'-phosphate oxidase family protein [Bacilli bacterium]